MKLKLLSLLLLITTISKAQEIFSTAFQGNSPLPLVTIGDELFVSVFGDNNERVAGVYKLPFDNPSAIETVSEASIQPGLGSLYLAHDPELNFLFATLPNLIKIDLNQGLPATDEVFVDGTSLNIGTNNGLIYHEGFIYFPVLTSDNWIIYRADTLGASAPELFFTVPFADNGLVITQIINNELYYFKYNSNDDADLLKIDLTNPTSETLVSIVDDFGQLFVQSSHYVNNTLFVGLETNSSNPSIIKFDLSENLPITAEPIEASITASSVLGITSYENDLYYTNTGDQTIVRLENGALNVSDFEDIELSVFPNPTSDKLFIKGAIKNQLDYQIIDVLGKRINEGIYTAEGIDLSRLDTGIYFVKLTDANGSMTTQKIVKN
ncbi:T9SS type A sorting domain-containing protein [Dokdonia ponticola]|uniref:T9SS type A sorting domain-containing protein n=1 Tax=Dokdonia ponticola TaxID=2041041 RepID=A0ABV9HWE4_9FLAO